MKPMKCPHCGGTYIERHEDFQFDDHVCGTLVLPKAAFDKCDACGDVLLHPGTGDRMSALIEKTIHHRLGRLPVGDFIMAKQAATLLDISVQAFNKHRRIQRGFIHQVELDGHKCYHRGSVLLFKKTSDGRFPLASATQGKSAPTRTVSWGRGQAGNSPRRASPIHLPV